MRGSKSDRTHNLRSQLNLLITFISACSVSKFDYFTCFIIRTPRSFSNVEKGLERWTTLAWTTMIWTLYGWKRDLSMAKHLDFSEQTPRKKNSRLESHILDQNLSTEDIQKLWLWLHCQRSNLRTESPGLPFNRNAKTMNESCISLHNTVQHLKQILMQKWHSFQQQPLLSNIFKDPPIIPFKRGRSFKIILVLAKL